MSQTKIHFIQFKHTYIHTYIQFLILTIFKLTFNKKYISELDVQIIVKIVSVIN